ncbi:hypothetical protein Tco_1318425 [Tanacetum coccineum]
MLQSPPVRRALSSRLRLQHLKEVRFQRRDADISSGIGLHVPRLLDKSQIYHQSLITHPKAPEHLAQPNIS